MLSEGESAKQKIFFQMNFIKQKKNIIKIDGICNGVWPIILDYCKLFKNNLKTTIKLIILFVTHTTYAHNIICKWYYVHNHKMEMIYLFSLLKMTGGSGLVHLLTSEQP